MLASSQPLGTLPWADCIQSQANLLNKKKYFSAANPTEDVQRLTKSKYLATLLQHATDPTFPWDPIPACDSCDRISILTSQFGLGSQEFQLLLRLDLPTKKSTWQPVAWWWSQKGTGVDWSNTAPIRYHNRRIRAFKTRSGTFLFLNPRRHCRKLLSPSSEVGSFHGRVHLLARPLWLVSRCWEPGSRKLISTALGAVLLEVGLWQKLSMLDHRPSTNDPLQIQHLLLWHANQRLSTPWGLNTLR